jgi:hypothetical protein
MLHPFGYDVHELMEYWRIGIFDPIPNYLPEATVRAFIPLFQHANWCDAPKFEWI